MWIPTKSEAVEMFARQFGARHHGGAVQTARDTAHDLKNHGDVAGYEVWCEVAATIERLQNGSARTIRDLH